MLRWQKLAISLFSLLFVAMLAYGQRDLGTITGTISDQQGAAVPNAKVTIKDTATGVTYETVTNDTGNFTRPALNPSTYTVIVEAAGFEKTQQANILVNPGEPVAVNLSLKVGSATLTVEVTATAALLQTESPAISENLSSAQVSELPLGGQRVFTYLARLTPGVVPAESGARDSNGGGFSANGVRSTGENNFLLNGVDNNVNVIDFINQTSFVIGPSVEAIGDMQVITNGASAEYGRAAGGILDITLKSGTNQLHGVLFEVLQNTVLDANSWTNNLNGVPRDPIKQNQFGAAAGAPIIKNKLFIFGDYQGTRIRTSGGSVDSLGYGGNYTIPTAQERVGNFSGTGQSLYDPTTTICTSGCVPGTITAAPGATPVYTRANYAGNQLPVREMDPVAMKLAALYPATNRAIAPGAFPTNDFYTVTPGSLNTDQGDGRVDYHLNDSNSIFGSISWTNTQKLSVTPFGGALDGGNFSGNSEQDLGRNGNLSWSHIFSPTLVNEARVGFSRLVTARTQANANTDEYKAFGIGGYDPTTTLNGGLPQFDLGRYSQIGANDWLPTKEYNNEWDLIDNVTISRGKHSIKLGAEFRELHFPFFQVPEPHGEIGFSRTETAYPSLSGNLTPSTTGDEFASFLLGAIDSDQISTTNFISSTKQAYAGYVQDNWKITSKLNLNLGLRYELFSPIGEQFGRQSNFDLQNLTLYIPTGPNQNAPLPSNFNAPATVDGVTFPALFTTPITVSRGKVNNYLIPWDKKDFGPRLGFGYSVRDRTVIRGFYGIFYGGEENQGGNPNRGESAPFNESPQLNRPNGVDQFQPDPLMANGNATGGLTVGFPTNVFTGYPVSSLAFREVAQDFDNPMVQEWNLSVQHEFTQDLALEVGYLGNHQSHQLYQPNPNTGPLIFTSNPAITGTSTSLYPDLGGVSGTATFGFGNYNAMTAKLTKRMSNGLTFQTAYTYGHSLADTGTTLSGSSGFYTVDNANQNSSYSSSAWDIRHNFVSSFNYSLPFGKGKQYASSMNRIAEAALGNWQVNGILSLRTGQPYTLDSGGCLVVNGGCGPEIMPGKNPNAAPPGGRTPSEWFDTANFLPVGTQGLSEGNVGLQTNTGPPTRTLDFSIFKDFAFTERFKLEFRAEGTNVANTPQFSSPSNSQTSGNFGQVTSTNAGTERHIQFQLRLRF
jgi:hypothetical protein